MGLECAFECLIKNESLFFGDWVIGVDLMHSLDHVEEYLADLWGKEDSAIDGCLKKVL
jgi:hypothetical protein